MHLVPCYIKCLLSTCQACWSALNLSWKSEIFTACIFCPLDVAEDSFQLQVVIDKLYLNAMRNSVPKAGHNHACWFNIRSLFELIISFYTFWSTSAQLKSSGMNNFPYARINCTFCYQNEKNNDKFIRQCTDVHTRTIIWIWAINYQNETKTNCYIQT